MTAVTDFTQFLIHTGVLRCLRDVRVCSFCQPACCCTDVMHRCNTIRSLILYSQHIIKKTQRLSNRSFCITCCLLCALDPFPSHSLPHISCQERTSPAQGLSLWCACVDNNDGKRHSPEHLQSSRLKMALMSSSSASSFHWWLKLVNTWNWYLSQLIWSQVDSFESVYCHYYEFPSPIATGDGILLSNMYGNKRIGQTGQ